MRLLLIAGLVVALAPDVQAQPTENVTVTSTRERRVLEKFVEGFSSANRLTGKLARWSDGVCPVTVGLAPRFNAFVSQHLRKVANSAGAPVAPAKSCKPNIEIAFTPAPQAFIDKVRVSNEVLLGYHDNGAQLDRLATVTRPIQAWYTTATKDLRGKTEVDIAGRAGIGLALPCDSCPGKVTYLPNATGGTTTGSRLGDGMTSALYHVIIVADSGALKDYEIGTLADVIAMLALAQVHIPNGCQPLSSIIALLLPGCGEKSAALTDADRGYLKGLYRMDSGRILRTQQDQIAYQMEQTLAGK
jgi:hypothetical protein